MFCFYKFSYFLAKLLIVFMNLLCNPKADRQMLGIYKFSYCLAKCLFIFMNLLCIFKAKRQMQT